MVSSVSSTPYYSYLNQLQGASQAKPGGNQTLVSQLLGGGFQPETLSLIRPSDGSKFNPVTDLLGGSGTSDALTQLYSNLYYSSAAATITQAQENAAPGSAPITTSSGSGSSTPTPTSNNVQNLINQQTQASIAYNKTLQQNVANTVKSIINA